MEYDVIALGELLVDFCAVGSDKNGVAQFAANPGGAPCNVLGFLARQGRKTGFIGKVGRDLLGSYLKEIIVKVGIDPCGLAVDPDVPTTLAFVRTDDSGERSFSFFRNPGADCCLTVGDCNPALLTHTKIFHFGSLSLTHLSARLATQFAVQTAKEAGAMISFDPNWRPALWDNAACAREQMRYGCSVCDFLKIEREELLFVTGETDERSAVAWLWERYSISLITVTAGAEGAAAYYKGTRIFCPAVTGIPVTDTTGAGDAFCAGCLDWLLEHPIATLAESSLQQMLSRASAGAAFVIQKPGALLSMPTSEQLDFILEQQENDSNENSSL